MKARGLNVADAEIVRMIQQRTATRSIWSKDGSVIAPRTRIDLLPWPLNEWRLAVLPEERQRIVKLSIRDVETCTEPSR